MKSKELIPSRREFVQTLALGATGVLAGGAVSASSLPMDENRTLAAADVWFKKVKGKHRICYDAPEPHDGFPVIWSWVFYKTNNDTGTQDNDMTAMVVLRHNAIPLAMEDRLWEKYKFGEVFKINDPTTSAPSTRNIYYEPTHGPFKAFGIEGIKALQARGVMFCVCDMALTVYSTVVAQNMSLDPAEVKKDWVSGLLPDMQPVPSGVWAIGRAQQKGCAYCYAGG